MIRYAKYFREEFALTDGEWESGAKLPILHGYTPDRRTLDLFFDTETKSLLRCEWDGDVGPKKMSVAQIDPNEAAWDTIMSLFKEGVKRWYAGSYRKELMSFLDVCSYTLGAMSPHASLPITPGGAPMQIPPWRMSVPWDIQSLWVYTDPVSGFESRDFTQVVLSIQADVDEKERQRLGIPDAHDSVPVCEHPGMKRIGRFELDPANDQWVEPNHTRSIRIRREPYA